MELRDFFIYLVILAGSTYLIRTIPFVLVKKKIENRFIRSFLYYIPYAVLTAMTVPAIFYSTDYVVSAIVGFAVAVILALKRKSLTVVAVVACISVYVVECILRGML